MSQLNVEIVRSIYDAFDSRDMEGVLLHVDDAMETVAADGVPWSGTYSGPSGFQDFIELVEDHVRFSIHTDELIDSGEHVAQIGRTIGQAYATGNYIDSREIHVWGLRNGKVITFRNYADTSEQRRALGLS